MTLTILIWLPLAAALVGALLPQSLAARITCLGSFGALGVAVAVLLGFQSAEGLQFVTDQTWIGTLGIHYKLGVDGLNVLLLLLTTATFTTALFAANLREWDNPKLFYFYIALAESAVLGAFCAQDLILFVLFFDLMLVPFYFLTGCWGGKRRVQATTKMVIYTLVGSLLMLVAAVATGLTAADNARATGGTLSFALSDIHTFGLPESSQRWIFLLFAAAFLIKMPAVLVHGWMPDAYRAMPIPVLAVFSAVLSKVAAYGFLRIALPLFPQASEQFQLLLMTIAVASILYGSVMAFTQQNVRLIVGFSSVAQLGFITLGIFSLTPEGNQGAIFQMVNHGLIVVPLFLLLAVLSKRAGGKENLREMGGMAFRAPVLATLFLIVALTTLAIPGSPNFVAEFLILLGAFKTNLALAVVASIGVVLASVYMLRSFIGAMHNRSEAKVESQEIGFVDALSVIPLIAVILVLGFYPQAALKQTDHAVNQLYSHSTSQSDSCKHLASRCPHSGLYSDTISSLHTSQARFSPQLDQQHMPKFEYLSLSNPIASKVSD